MNSNVQPIIETLSKILNAKRNAINTLLGEEKNTKKEMDYIKKTREDILNLEKALQIISGQDIIPTETYFTDEPNFIL